MKEGKEGTKGRREREEIGKEEREKKREETKKREQIDEKNGSPYLPSVLKPDIDTMGKISQQYDP